MLIKGDLYLRQNLLEVMENGFLDENPRPKYESDNVPAYTQFTTQVFEKYDLSKGEYPFSLARRIAVKTGIKEILAIYQGQQNSREGFENYGIKWWEPWFNKQGTLGRAYPYNLESHRPNDVVRNYIEVDRKIIHILDCVLPDVSTDIDEDITLYTENELEKLRTIWTEVICNDVINDKTNTYVHKSWFTFKQFLLDLPYVPQFHLARENGFNDYELTTVYYNSNCWSKETCVFLERNEILEYKEYNNLNNSNKKLLRKELSRNQVVELITGLKNDPFGRRHITSFWNWANIDKKTLVECAYETIWSCRRGKDGEIYIDMTLIQRSNDVAVAGNINKLQYCALMLMIANQCGYKVGVFSHFIQNFHIYDRHTEQVETILERLEQLEKEDCVQPTLELNTNKDFFQITLSDFEVINYNPNPNQLKFELAI